MAKAKRTKQPRIGRPAGRKPLLNLRVDLSLHRRLEQAAAASGRTISEEAVRLMDYGLQSPSLLEQAIKLTFGAEITIDLMMIGHYMKPEAEGLPDWHETPEKFDRVKNVVNKFFDDRDPRGGMVSATDENGG